MNWGDKSKLVKNDWYGNKKNKRKEKILIREIETTQINQMKITELKNIIPETKYCMG